MKKILLIATGGTIASKSMGEGLTPLLHAEEILNYVPETKAFCEAETLQLMNIDSTNMSPAEWIKIASAIEKEYDNYDGFIVLHGTDTMSYMAAALSYLVQNSVKPIVLTGAQRPIDQEITDAVTNLFDSFLYACDKNSHGVSIVFGGRVILGTRARKIRTKSFNAFTSMDYPDIAVIRDQKILRYIHEEISGPPVFYHKMNPRVFLLKLIPGISADIFEYLKKHYDAVIVESFGVGGLPSYGEENFENAVEEWTSAGKLIIMTTQVPHEGSDISVYNVGMKYKKKYGLIESYDMTLESTVTKLMWILGQTADRQEIENLFYKVVSRDILY